MENKKNTTSKRSTCPTCKKYLSNDVAALRIALDNKNEQLGMYSTQLDAAKAELTALRGHLDSLTAGLKTAQADAKHWHDAYENKKQMCEALQEYDHWLTMRNLWQRIVNTLEP